MTFRSVEYRQTMERGLAYHRMNADPTIFNPEVRLLLRNSINKTPDEISKSILDTFGELIKQSEEIHKRDIDKKTRFVKNLELKEDIERQPSAFNQLVGNIPNQAEKFDMGDLQERVRNLRTNVNEEDRNVGRINRDVGEFNREMKKAVAEYGMSVFRMTPAQVLRLRNQIIEKYNNLTDFLGEYEDYRSKELYTTNDLATTAEGYGTEIDDELT